PPARVFLWHSVPLYSTRASRYGRAHAAAPDTAAAPDRRSADAVPLAGPADAVDGAVRSDPRPAAGRRGQPVPFDSRWERDFPMTTRALLALGLALGVPAVAPPPLRAGPVRTGFDANALAVTDDGSSAAFGLGFTVNFFGKLRDSVFVNANGNVTFTSA